MILYDNMIIFILHDFYNDILIMFYYNILYYIFMCQFVFDDNLFSILNLYHG